MTDKKDMVLQALQRLVGDTSVPASETLEALEEIADEVDMQIEALKDTMDG